jgi:serine/threonine-protein kinase HipA
MAKLLWGKVYYQDQFAGVLREEPGYATSFAYDSHYLNGKFPRLSHTLPLREEPFMSQIGLLPFFDNLVSEGWLEHEQKRLLNREASRLELLLAFGYDCAGAVSVLDPDPMPLKETDMDKTDEKEAAVFQSRASLSGVQPKLALVERAGKFYPTKIGELSTHLGKFSSEDKKHPDIIYNEYLTTLAFKYLLSDDALADLQVGTVEGIKGEALIIKRFDRTHDGKRIHFEEFNQLLGHISKAKYEGDYADMANFMSDTPGCLALEKYRLFRRILAGILTGNTDMHLKNFAMFHTSSGLRLTPSYDQVGAIIYKYQHMALSLNGTEDVLWGNIKSNSIVRLGEQFQLNKESIEMAIDHFKKQLPLAHQKVAEATVGSSFIKNKIINVMETRWNGTFSSIGKRL